MCQFCNDKKGMRKLWGTAATLRFCEKMPQTSLKPLWLWHVWKHYVMGRRNAFKCL